MFNVTLASYWLYKKLILVIILVLALLNLKFTEDSPISKTFYFYNKRENSLIKTT